MRAKKGLKSLKLPLYQGRRSSREEPMIEHDFPEEFVPIAAELQRLPYLSPSRGFADRVISRIDRLQPEGVASVIASRHLELHQGGQAVVSRRPVGLVRASARATAGV